VDEFSASFKYQDFPNLHVMAIRIAFSLGLVAVFSIMVISATQQPAFADRTIYFDKVLDINKDSLEQVMGDLKNMPKIFPDFIESVEYSNNEEKKLAKIALNLNGFHVYPQIKYSQPSQGWHIVQVVSGDLKGTKLFTKFDETWGFDGSPNQGTIVNIEMNLRYSGISSFLGIVSDKTLEYSLDRFLIQSVSFANSNGENYSEDQDDDKKADDEKKSKQQVVKKSYRKR